MGMNDRDRRRVTLALLVTLAAAPVIAFAGASTGDSSPSASTVVAEGASTDHANSLPLPEPGFAEPVFMDGVEVDPDPQSVAIAIPPRPTETVISGSASYKSGVLPGRCTVDGTVPRGVEVTVVNVDNGHSVRCTTSLGPANQTVPVVLSREAFARIADLTDAPIFVEIRV